MKLMKKIFILLFVLHSPLIPAQPIQLPVYTEGVYECDTLLALTSPINDIIGKVLLKDGLTTSLLTGVKFYLLAGLHGPAGNIIQDTQIDSSGVKVPIRSGGKYEIPTQFVSLNYPLSWYIILEGTPAVRGESYFCDLSFFLPLLKTTIPEEVYIKKYTQKTCAVDGPQGIDVTSARAASYMLYPNPTNGNMIIQTTMVKPSSEFTLFDSMGKELLKGTLLNEFTLLNMEPFPAGIYYIRIGREHELISQLIKK